MIVIFLALFPWISSSTATSINKQCRDLLQCTIKQKCVNSIPINDQPINLIGCGTAVIYSRCHQVSMREENFQLPWLVDKIKGKEISIEMYNDIDSATDYGCIFTAGCLDECNRCPLCSNSKLQVVEILSGTQITDDMECPDLLKCATECVSRSADDISMINHCLRHTCAYHCFDGTCPKCSAFVTRIFNQMCASGNLRKITKNFQGQCYEMFKEIVYTKFKPQFDQAGIKPAIGPRQL